MHVRSDSETVQQHCKDRPDVRQNCCSKCQSVVSVPLGISRTGPESVQSQGADRRSSTDRGKHDQQGKESVRKGESGQNFLSPMLDRMVLREMTSAATHVPKMCGIFVDATESSSDLGPASGATSVTRLHASARSWIGGLTSCPARLSCRDFNAGAGVFRVADYICGCLRIAWLSFEFLSLD